MRVSVLWLWHGTSIHMVIFRVPWHSHLLPSVKHCSFFFTCFYDLLIGQSRPGIEPWSSAKMTVYHLSHYAGYNCVTLGLIFWYVTLEAMWYMYNITPTNYWKTVRVDMNLYVNFKVWRLLYLFICRNFPNQTTVFSMLHCLDEVAPVIMRTSWYYRYLSYR